MHYCFNLFSVMVHIYNVPLYFNLQAYTSNANAVSDAHAIILYILYDVS